MAFLKGGGETYRGREIAFHETHDVGDLKVVIAVIIPGLNGNPVSAFPGWSDLEENARINAVAAAKEAIDAELD